MRDFVNLPKLPHCTKLGFQQPGWKEMWNNYTGNCVYLNFKILPQFLFSIGKECMDWSDARLCTSSWWLAQVIGLISESNSFTADENLDIV